MLSSIFRVGLLPDCGIHLTALADVLFFGTNVSSLSSSSTSSVGTALLKLPAASVASSALSYSFTL